MLNATPYVLTAPRARHVPRLGVLTTLVPLQIVDAVLAEHGVITKRLRRLPMTLLVYFLLAMALFPSLSYRELQAQLEDAWQRRGAGPWRKVTRSAISHARDKLPWQVLATLFSALALPGFDSNNSRWRGYRLAALDGSTMEMASSKANQAVFSGPQGKDRRRVGYPQLRIVALVDCWTRAALAALAADFGRGESRLAAELVDKITKGMLVLADRGFVGVELITLIKQAGGEILWRVKKGIASRPLAMLPDGSYLTEMRAHSHHGRGWVSGQRPQPITVRVIEFRLHGRLHRLLTTLLDPVQAPARELILLYCLRWQIETFYRECKGNERGRRQVLRSRTPGGVLQEIWATLIVHLLTRSLICWVVKRAQLADPRLVSYTHATAFIREHLRETARLSWPRLLRWAVAALTQPAACLSPPPQPRPSTPRQLKTRPLRYPSAGSKAAAIIQFDPDAIVLQPCLLAA
jgi:hypothetical protein